MLSASMLKSSPMSANRAVAPASRIAFSVATNVNGRRDHLVARPDPERLHRHDQRGRAVVDRDRVLDPVQLGELALEALHVGALRELTRAEHLEDERLLVGAESDRRDRDHRSASSLRGGRRACAGDDTSGDSSGRSGMPTWMRPLIRWRPSTPWPRPRARPRRRTPAEERSHARSACDTADRRPRGHRTTPRGASRQVATR